MVQQGLDGFHPQVRGWFEERFGQLTAAQELAWPHIAHKENVLVLAPTGSGKTLTAFLWALNQLAAAVWEPGGIRVLYVSPLRALNNDIQRNLLEPLAGLKQAFAAQEIPWPEIKVATRSGDTPQSERRRMLRAPPEILITTPESLNILLTSASGQTLFRGLQTVIVDEVHALAGSKRGTHLMSAVERLTMQAGEFQRIALSATVSPAQRVARFIGGREQSGRQRAVRVLDAGSHKKYELTVRLPERAERSGIMEPEEIFWDSLAREMTSRIQVNRSTLIFANSRRSVEKVARLVNGEGRKDLVYSHHGSLSREIRQAVEARLKAGQLEGIVATNSLELGIDVGAIDEVLLVQSPPSITSAVQRVGRAGHGVGLSSRAVLYPSHPRDLLDAAVIARSLVAGETEPIVVPEAPLDVLAQVVLSMTVNHTWGLDELFDFVRRIDPYADLSRRRFDLVIEMLAGRYAGARVRSLKPRLAYDRVAGSIRARPGVARLLYMGGGTIPDRGMFNLRLADSRARIGTLDEEFVWERTEGEVFTLGVQSWRVQRITHNDVLVTPAGSGPSMAPFWRSEERDSRYFLAQRLGRFMERADDRLEQPEFKSELEDEHYLESEAAEALIDLLRRQKLVCGGSLPHRHHLVVERVADPQSRRDRPSVVWHTTWGGKVNRPLALALAQAFSVKFELDLDVGHDDHCIVMSAEADLPLAEVLALVTPENVENLVHGALAGTGFFGASFRENASRAMLLPRQGFKRRTPLWLSRQRSKELLSAVSGFDDFPVVLETYRTCLLDELELQALRRLLAEVARGDIRVSQVTTSRPSPLAAEVFWKRTNKLMYEDDEPRGNQAGLQPTLLQEVVHSSWLRPRLDPQLVAEFEGKLQRIHPGYSPTDSGELVEWLKERLLIPEGQWLDLLRAMERDHQIERAKLWPELEARAVALQTPGGHLMVCAVENFERLRRTLGWGEDHPVLSPAGSSRPASSEALAAIASLARVGSDGRGDDPRDDLALFLAEWLRYSGPLVTDDLAGLVGLEPEQVDRALAALAEDDQIAGSGGGPSVILDEIRQGAQAPEVCDTENLERMLRLARARSRPQFSPLPLEKLPLLLAQVQGLGQEESHLGDNESRLAGCLERLFGYPAPAGLWESELLPARLSGYRQEILDGLFLDSDLTWQGCGPERLTFCLSGDRSLFGDWEPHLEDEQRLESILPAGPGHYRLADLAAQSGEGTAGLTRLLWQWSFSGLVSNDTFSAVRRGVDSGFSPEETGPANSGRSGRRRFGAWRASRPFPGNWFRLEPILPPEDALESDELQRERTRVVLERYGVVFRELLARELPQLRWARLFRALRLMELSGEIISGVFFEGIAGPQFILPAALRMLSEGLDEERSFWMCASDPASPCGLGLGGFKLPRRLASNHMVYRGATPVIISERSGSRLEFNLPPEDPELPGMLDFLERVVERKRRVQVETINHQPAQGSDYREVLEQRFTVEASDGSLRLNRRF